MSHLSGQVYRHLFKASPGKILVLRPHSYEIVAVTDAYLQATMTHEVDIVGKTLFEVFPDDPDDQLADGTKNLLASLERVQALRQADVVGVLRYPVPRPDGSFEERFWTPVNSPVLNETGEIEYIMHRVEDVTQAVEENDELYLAGSDKKRDSVAIRDIILRSQELRQALSKLQEYEARMRTAERLLNLGAWEFDVKAGQLSWTEQVFDIYDMPASDQASDFADYFARVHPDDREASRAVYEKFAENNAPHIEFEHRVIGRNGAVKYVKGVGERHVSADREIVVGYVQDITPLISARDKLSQAVQQRRDMLESISDAFYALDEQWNFTYVNQQAALLLERPRDELLGQNLWHEFPQAVGSQFQRHYELAVESRQTSQFQAFYAPLGKWFEVSAYPIPDGLTVYFRDVTREREHQEQLRLVDAALSRQNDAVIITEADVLNAPHGPMIVYVNDAFERLTGYSKSEAIGRTPRLFHGPGTDREQLDRIRSALRNAEPVRCELMNYHKSGASYWLELDITPLFDQSGVCTHFVSVQRNITQRKQQEAELRQAQERFQLIAKATNDVIWDWDLVSNRFWWSDSMTEVFGFSLSELDPGPESWTQHTHPDDLDRVVKSVYEAIQGTGRNWNSEYRFIRRNGQYAHVIDRGFVIRDDSGKAIRMVGSMLDISDRMDMEQRLRESQKLEAVGHLTGGVAHDFNNLLTVIQGNAEMLADLSTDPELQPMAQMTLAAAQRGAVLTSRLLAFARRQPLDPKLTDINQLVEAMQALVRRTLPASIELEFVPDPDLGITEIDAGELDTALLNLVVNARDAMRGVGKLTIETTNVVLDEDYAEHHVDVAAGEYVMVGVSDTGAGMTPEMVQHAFEPFYTTKAVGKGSGLGLSMVFGFTKQSGGHIKIYSEPGEGTSVKLYFPRIYSARTLNYHPTPDLPLQGGVEHILIAEDDDLVLQHLEGQLRSLGYRVTAVTSGPQALKALAKHSDIDLLLTDIIMPGGMNGRELADQARVARPLLKVLFSSGYTENAIVHHGRLDPGVELLSKPYSRLELASKVRHVLDAGPENVGDGEFS